MPVQENGKGYFRNAMVRNLILSLFFFLSIELKEHLNNLNYSNSNNELIKHPMPIFLNYCEPGIWSRPDVMSGSSSRL